MGLCGIQHRVQGRVTELRVDFVLVEVPGPELRIRLGHADQLHVRALQIPSEEASSVAVRQAREGDSERLAGCVGRTGGKQRRACA